MSWRQITLGLTKPSRAKARVISQTLPGFQFHHGIWSRTPTAGPLPLTNAPRINLRRRSHGTRRHSAACPTPITLLNPEEKPHPARRAPPFRAIRTTAGEPGGRPPIRTMEKVSAPRTRTSWGVSACGCAMPFSARTLFVTAPTRLGVEELSQIEVFDTIRRANSMRMLGQRFQGEFLGGTLHRFWATAA